MLVVKVSFSNKVGVVLAAAVRTDVPLSLGASVVVTPLADFGAAWVFLAEGASRMMEHSLGQFFLLSQSPLECFFLLFGAVWESSVVTGVRRGAWRIAIIRAGALVRRGVAVATLSLLVTVETLPSSSCAPGLTRLRLAALNVAARSGNLAIGDHLIVVGLHFRGDAVVNLLRDVANGVMESLKTLREKPTLQRRVAADLVLENP